MKKRIPFVAGLLVGLGVPTAPALAQSRVVVPIVIQAPRPAVRPAAAATPSIAVTTRTLTPRPGTTTTLVTVQNTTGRPLGVVPATGMAARPPAGTSAHSLSGTSVHSSSPNQGMAAMALPPGVVRSRITIQDATVDAPSGVDPAPVTLTVTRWHTGLGQEKVSITSEGPIDAPIVILAQ